MAKVFGPITLYEHKGGVVLYRYKKDQLENARALMALPEFKKAFPNAYLHWKEVDNHAA